MIPSVAEQDHGFKQFTTTRWGVVLQAAQLDDIKSKEALQELCQQYWFPLYAFVRRNGYPPQDAADLTQDFFAKLLATDFPAGMDPQRGRFRNFLLTSLHRFLINKWQKARRQKRGGGGQALSLEMLIEERGETGYLAELSHNETPEHLFQRTWAETLLKRVFKRLEEECARRGDTRFATLRPFLSGSEDHLNGAAAAAALGLSLAAFKSLLHRFRQRYRELLFDEVRQTVESPDEVAAELQAIIRSLRC